ncbi:MAG: hypothetical protein WCE23_01420 [Candidatus Binatus sp.]|uniref:hypothetical protein n=1 Tax=Candidatus Binatus sp. TaxID=2811406 RepID=UPI003C73DDAE
MSRLFRALTCPEPYRARLFRGIIKRWRLGSYLQRLEVEAIDRPWYGWCVYHAAVQARALGLGAITVAEMGVAGGAGLLCLCDHAAEVERLTGVAIAIYGFDAGSGLPRSDDPRDLLYCWPADSFEMNVARLRERIGSRATLVIGDVRETVAGFQPPQTAPLGAVIFDVDLYTSTLAALKILDVRERLPRVWCWFDDIIGYPENLYCERNGERAAINEYNATRSDRAFLSPANCFAGEPIPRYWHQQVFIDHRFEHPAYNRCLSKGPHQLPLA